MKQLEKVILQETQGLSPAMLNQILDFIRFIKNKNLNEEKETILDNIQLELSLLDKNEMTHLKEEFRDYKKAYPYEN